MVVLVVCSKLYKPGKTEFLGSKGGSISKISKLIDIVDNKLILLLFHFQSPGGARDWRGLWSMDEGCSSGWHAMPHHKFVLTNFQGRRDKQEGSDYRIWCKVYFSFGQFSSNSASERLCPSTKIVKHCAGVSPVIYECKYTVYTNAMGFGLEKKYSISSPLNKM